MTDQSHQSRSVSADWILNRIQKRKRVRLRNAVIEGDLDVSKLDLPTEHVDRTEYQLQIPGLLAECKIVSSSIEITNSEFKGTVNFSNCILKVATDFRGATFSGDVWFIGATFSGDAWFNVTTFSRDAWFDDATFSRDAEFGGTTFNGDAKFLGNKFNKNVDFKDANFSEGAHFRDTNLSGDACFEGATFSKNTDFWLVRFDGDVNFKRALFGDDANFVNVEFTKEANFNNSFFKKYANFRGSTFHELTLQDIEFNKIYIEWNSMKKIKGHFDQKVLLSLIENYKERGFFEDADDCYYFFRKSRRKYLFPLLRPFDLALMAFYGYGTKPFWAFMWFVSIFAVFGVAYLIFGRSMGFTSAISPLEAINISSAVILSGTKLVESPQPNTSILYLIFMIEKLLGSLFFFLFLVSVGRTIIR